MPVVFVSAILLAMLAQSVVLHLGVPRWVVSGVLLVMASLLHFLRVALHRRHARRYAKALAGPAGGVVLTRSVPVPRWGLELTNLAVGMTIAALLPLAESLAP